MKRKNAYDPFRSGFAPDVVAAIVTRELQGALLRYARLRCYAERERALRRDGGMAERFEVQAECALDAALVLWDVASAIGICDAPPTGAQDARRRLASVAGQLRASDLALRRPQSGVLSPAEMRDYLALRAA